MSANVTTLKKCHSMLGISTTALASIASGATTPTATTTVAGTVRQSAADVDSAPTVPAAAPAGGTGAAEGGWDTAANRDLAIATINGLRTALTALIADHNDLLAKLRTAGVIAP